MKYRTQIALDLSTNKISMERKIFGSVFSGEEYGSPRNFELRIDTNKFALARNRYTISLRNTDSNEYTDLLPGHTISREEAQKLAGFLYMKVAESNDNSEGTEKKKQIPLPFTSAEGFIADRFNVSRLSLTSIIVVGVSFFVFPIGGIFAIVAIILGILGLRDVKKNKKKGITISIIGIVLGSVNVLISIAIIILLVNAPIIVN